MSFRLGCSRRIGLLAMVLFPALVVAQPSQTRTDPMAFADLFASVLDENRIPGGAWAIVRDGRIVEAQGHGVRRLGHREPVTADTVFRIASLSKTFAAQLGAMLVDEGRLNWTEPASRFAPAFRLKRADQTARLQLQHLLGQSTGLVPNAYDNLIEDGEPLARILPRFASLEANCAIGSCYSYQNIAFSMVQPAFEGAGGASYEHLLQERLFQPLGMTATSVGLEAFAQATDRAEPHVRRLGLWSTVEVAPHYYRLAPAAGINASANDMARWLLAQMGGAPDVVTAAQVATLTGKRVRTPRELNRRGWRDLLSDAHYGLGWRIYTLGGEDIVMHSGWVQGYVADIAWSPSRRTGLVVLLNGASPAINDITTGFWSRTLGIAPRADAAAVAGANRSMPARPAPAVP